MKYLPDGRLDLSLVPVLPHELEYARFCSGKLGETRDQRVIRHNIALGKACGSYDPEPALLWWHMYHGGTLRFRVLPEVVS